MASAVPQDIVAASPANFNIAGFIPKLRDYLRVAHPNKRMFLVSWIMVRYSFDCGLIVGGIRFVENVTCQK